jgi:hypothetical protein
MIHRAKDLSASERSAIEALLGEPLAEQDDISIRRLTPPHDLSPERREEILIGLKKHFAQVDAQRQPVSPEEAEEAIDEALRSTRPNYRSVR